MRAPQITRLNTSRPSSSVPIRCSRLGGWSNWLAFIPSGSCGERYGAKMATTITTARMIAPATVSSLWARRRQVSPRRTRRTVGAATVPEAARACAWASAIVDPRIEVGVQDVHDQVHQDERGRHEQHPGLYDRIIAITDRVKDERPDTRQGEDPLDDDRAAEQIPDLHAGHCDDRDQGVSKRMLVDDRPLN